MMMPPILLKYRDNVGEETIKKNPHVYTFSIQKFRQNTNLGIFSQNNYNIVKDCEIED